MIKNKHICNILFFQVFSILLLACWVSGQDHPDYPEGYFPFEQSPMKSPPKVRKPPYTQTNVICRGRSFLVKRYKPSLVLTAGILLQFWRLVGAFETFKSADFQRAYKSLFLKLRRGIHKGDTAFLTRLKAIIILE